MDIQLWNSGFDECFLLKGDESIFEQISFGLGVSRGPGIELGD
jgi:hypothetical protein